MPTEEKISKEIASLKTRIKSLYQWLMPGLSHCFEDAYGQRAKSFYKRYTNPFRIKRLGISGLGKVLDKVGRQHPAEGLAKRIYEAALRACEMYDHADGYIDFDELQKEVDCELNLLESYEKVQKKVDQDIKRILTSLGGGHLKEIEFILDKEVSG